MIRHATSQAVQDLALEVDSLSLGIIDFDVIRAFENGIIAPRTGADKTINLNESNKEKAIKIVLKQHLPQTGIEDNEVNITFVMIS